MLFTPTFKGVTGQLDLTAIKVCNAEGSFLDDVYNMVSVQKMGVDGGYLNTYSYDEGWYDDDAGEFISEGVVMLKEGESICVSNDYGEPVYFMVSGEVDLVNKNFIGEGYILWGNGTPAAIDLTGVIIINSDGEVLDDVYNMVSVQKMGTDGGYLNTYSYDEGWFDDDAGEFIEEGMVTLDAGEACCVSNDYGEPVIFKVPSPIKK